MRPVDTLYLLGLAAIWGASFLFMRIIAPEIGTVPTSVDDSALNQAARRLPVP